MELDLAGMDAANNDGDSDIDLRMPEGVGSEDFEISDRQQILQIQVPSSNRDTSMISASGASSGQSSQQHNLVVTQHQVVQQPNLPVR